MPKIGSEYNVIWVIVDRLTKFAHFLPIKATKPIGKFVKLYVQYIARPYIVPTFILPLHL